MFKKFMKKVKHNVAKYTESGSGRRHRSHYSRSDSGRRSRHYYSGSGSSSRRSRHSPYQGSGRYKRKGFGSSS